MQRANGSGTEEDQVDGGTSLHAARGDSLDCDSDELEALEDAAELEGASDDELDRVVEEATLLYPPEKVADLLEDLKEGGLVNFLQLHVVGKTETSIKALFVALGVLLPKGLREGSVTPAFLISILKTVLARHLRQRIKLEQYNTVDDAVRLIGQSKRIIVLSGSGISTSVGIPDFRSKDGIYAQLQREGKYHLADPQEMFDKDFFLHDPSCFFSFAKSIFPSNFIPSPSHRFIKLLEDRNILLRNYTQNIDTLEQAAGIERVLYCHGSFSQAQCTTVGCGYKVAGSVIKPDIFAQRIPYCPRCMEAEECKKIAKKKKKLSGSKPSQRWREEEDSDGDDDDRLAGLGVMKPCITFFGEKLSDEFDQNLLLDRNEVDLLIVMGTSLKVAPVSELVGHIPHRTPVILINKTPVLHMGTLDIQLLGDADVVVEYICNQLKWSLPSPEPNKEVVGGQAVAEEMNESGIPGEKKENHPKRVGESHYWLFPGAEADGLSAVLEGEDDDSDSSGSNSSLDADSDKREQQERPPPASLNDNAKRGVKRAGGTDTLESPSEESRKHLRQG
ncbi:hypothetical protein CBS101457_005770 [Exobasidium rhododendri]|nr:hypothetical protein CBS101457_005770 [Exobasidium rhododendri]